MDIDKKLKKHKDRIFTKLKELYPKHIEPDLLQKYITKSQWFSPVRAYAYKILILLLNKYILNIIYLSIEIALINLFERC